MPPGSFGVLDLGCVWVASDAAECRILQPGGVTFLNNQPYLRFFCDRNQQVVGILDQRGGRRITPASGRSHIFANPVGQPDPLLTADCRE